MAKHDEETTLYKHVLIAVAFDNDSDPSRSIEVAKVLADKAARVTVLHVKEEVPGYAISYMPEEFDVSLKQEIRDRLSGIAKKFENGHGELVVGHSGRTILEWAGKNNVDCIVISSHKPGLQDYFLGSTAARVVRHAQCSVHVIR